MDPKDQTPSAETTSEATTPVAGPTTEPSGEQLSETLREEPNHSEDAERQETVPYQKFREKNAELQQAKRLIEQLTSGGQAYPSAPAQPVPNTGIPSQFLDEEGNIVDFLGYNQWSQSMAAEIAVERALNKVEQTNQLRQFEATERQELLDSFPQVKEDPELMDMIESMKKGSLLRGELVSLKDVAAKYFKNLEKVAKKAKDEVVVTRQIQETAIPQPTAKVSQDEQDMSDLQARLESKDPKVREQARIEYLIRLNKPRSK